MAVVWGLLHFLVMGYIGTGAGAQLSFQKARSRVFNFIFCSYLREFICLYYYILVVEVDFFC